jgi:hypothetical protein
MSKDRLFAAAIVAIGMLCLVNGYLIGGSAPVNEGDESGPQTTGPCEVIPVWFVSTDEMRAHFGSRASIRVIHSSKGPDLIEIRTSRGSGIIRDTIILYIHDNREWAFLAARHCNARFAFTKISEDESMLQVCAPRGRVLMEIPVDTLAMPYETLNAVERRQQLDHLGQIKP